jgi:DNA gyrase subunit A
LSRPEDLPAEYGLSEGGYRLSPVQAQAILDLRLHRLTGLEQRKLLDEYQELLSRIRDYLEILTVPERLTAVIRAELQELRAQYADARRTVDSPTSRIQSGRFDYRGNGGRHAVARRLCQIATAVAVPGAKRGGRGRAATTVKEEDFVDKLFIASTHDTVLCFSNRGKVYWKKVYELPQAGRTARGRPMVNLLPLEEGERINAVLSVREFDDATTCFSPPPVARSRKPRCPNIPARAPAASSRLICAMAISWSTWR